MNKPSIGRIVIFVGYDGEARPAIITKVREESCIDLQAFGDMTCSGATERGNVIGVYFTTTPGAFGWHWPERVA